MVPESLQRAARKEDPLLLSARREALVVLAIWAAVTIYVLTFCYRFGYGPAENGGLRWQRGDTAPSLSGPASRRPTPDSQPPPPAVRAVLGFPGWVFWGIAVPWLVGTVLTGWFALSFMQDEDLGTEVEPELPSADPNRAMRLPGEASPSRNSGGRS